MKKNSIIRTVLVICLIAMIAVCMCACGGGKDKAEKASSAKESTETVSQAEEETAEEAAEIIESAAETEEPQQETAEPQAETGITIEEYFNEHPDQLEEINKMVAETDEYQSWKDLLDYQVFASGNTLVYGYKYKQTYSQEKIDAAKEQIEENLNSLTDQMLETIDAVEAEYGVKDIDIQIVYFNGDGSLIGYKTYSK